MVTFWLPKLNLVTIWLQLKYKSRPFFNQSGVLCISIANACLRIHSHGQKQWKTLKNYQKSTFLLYAWEAHIRLTQEHDGVQFGVPILNSRFHSCLAMFGTFENWTIWLQLRLLKTFRFRMGVAISSTDCKPFEYQKSPVFRWLLYYHLPHFPVLIHKTIFLASIAICKTF